jgi:hypothetical protein
VPLQDELERYYEYYLPRQINTYRKMLEQNFVRSWFFGGGTPSLMTSNYLRNICSLLPGLKDRGEKTFEIHPYKFNFELLDILSEYNFHNVIIGVQSFDEAVLKKAGRLYVAGEELRTIIEEIQKRGMNAWCDIMGFINDEPAEITVLQNDLRLILALQPDEISICFNYGLRNKYTEEIADFLLQIYSSFIQDYKTEFNVDSKEQIKRYLQQHKVLRCFNKNKGTAERHQSFIGYLAGSNLYVKNRSILGIGSYKNQQHGTMSCVCTADYNYHYTEVNEDMRKSHYFVTYTGNFLAEIAENIVALSRVLDGTNHVVKMNKLSLFYNGHYDPGLARGGRDVDFSFDTEYIGPESENAQVKAFIDKYLQTYKKPFIDLSKI